MIKSISDTRNSIRKVFGTDTEPDNTSKLQQKVANAYGTDNSTGNPFLNSNGSLINKYINYQSMLDNPGISSKAKEYITQATGLTPSVVSNASVVDNKSESYQDYMQNNNVKANYSSGSYTSSVGKKVANTSNYSNDAAKGQCVWYVRGRASEKLGKDTGAIGNANEMWHNAKTDAKLTASTENIKPNMIVSYKTSGTGNQYGHVIYIEDVVGDTVYYTEGGSEYYNNGTDGVVKTATKEGVLNGVNTNGKKMGNGVIGFIDLEKY